MILIISVTRSLIRYHFINELVSTHLYIHIYILKIFCFTDIYLCCQTRMQNLAPASAERGMGETLMQMVRKEGLLRPVRGMSAVVVGAGPAHALYFSCYEHVRDILTKKPYLNKHIAYGKSFFFFFFFY